MLSEKRSSSWLLKSAVDQFKPQKGSRIPCGLSLQKRAEGGQETDENSEGVTNFTFKPMFSHHGTGRGLSPDQKTKQDLWQSLPGRQEEMYIITWLGHGHQDSEAKFLKFQWWKTQRTNMAQLYHLAMRLLSFGVCKPGLHYPCIWYQRKFTRVVQVSTQMADFHAHKNSTAWKTTAWKAEKARLQEAPPKGPRSLTHCLSGTKDDADPVVFLEDIIA